ncbi:MAG: hypothetical protein CSB47_01600 [Proteobacteria bacterium]|nr:MAG: hypothetical protein CSB47_01600 [Pseudomonadota bacterium]
MKCRGWVGVAVFCLSVQAQASDAGSVLLSKMNNALRGLDYSGILVHIKGDVVNTLQVTHRVEDGVEREVVTSLNTDASTVSNERPSFSLATVPYPIESMKKVYSLDVGAVKKVAQRSCQIVVARPKDKMRYLQRYCIDTQTGLPLSYSLINNKHKIVERFAFTQIEVDEVSGSEIALAPAAENRVMLSSVSRPERVLQGDWELLELPEGFHFGQLSPSQQADMQKDVDTEYFVLTDGLSSVSVFICPIDATQPSTASMMNSGALNVLTSQKNKHRITLVGEVPRSTMQRIFSNLKYRGK